MSFAFLQLQTNLFNSIKTFFFLTQRLAIASRLQQTSAQQMKPIKIEIHRESVSPNANRADSSNSSEEQHEDTEDQKQAHEAIDKLKKLQLLQEIESVKPDHEQRQLAIEV